MASILQGLAEVFRNLADYVLQHESAEERMISMAGVFAQVDVALREYDADMWLHDLYMDAGGMVVLASKMGRLYRIPVTVAGTDVTLGAVTEVELDAQPVRQRENDIFVTRQADGRARCFIIACSAILNRVGEIDSRALFDSFLASADREGYPELRFYHQPAMRIGQIDFLARDGYLLLASGLLDDERENPLAAAFVDALENGRGAWGASHGFRPAKPPELLGVAEGVTIPVYTTGVLREISVLPEAEAAAWLTAIQTTEVTRMHDRVKKALETLFGSPEGAAAFIETVDERNRSIESDPSIIARENPDEEAVNEEAAETEPIADEGVEETIAEEETRALDDATLDEIATRAAAKVTVPAPDTTVLDALRAQVAEQIVLAGELERRIETLEATDDEKRQKWQADLPVQRGAPIRRPRETHAASEGEAPNLADIAASTLAKLPARK